MCALRGFGTFKVSLGTATYGEEMENCIRRQGRSERDRFRREKLRIPISYRIAKAATTGSFGNVVSEGTSELTITLADCIAMDSIRYRAHRWDGEKTEAAGKEPQTMNCFANAAKQRICLFGLLYGQEHVSERKRALKKLIWFHDQLPELFTVAFLVTAWNRFRYEYTEAIREGVHTLIRLLPEGRNGIPLLPSR